MTTFPSFGMTTTQAIWGPFCVTQPFYGRKYNTSPENKHQTLFLILVPLGQGCKNVTEINLIDKH